MAEATTLRSVKKFAEVMLRDSENKALTAKALHMPEDQQVHAVNTVIYQMGGLLAEALAKDLEAMFGERSASDE